MGITAKTVLILDTCTFVEEIGLTSKGGSALKHYLYRREMQLVVPEVVAEESERHLARRARGKRQSIVETMRWLTRFFGELRAWPSPTDDTLEGRARELARAEHLGAGAVVVSEPRDVRQRAESRHAAELPPSHKRPSLADCRIWEHCMHLLANCRVVFVSSDSDFCGHRQPKELHPTLQAEAEGVGEDRLTFYPDMKSLLSEFEREIRPLPDSSVFDFVYTSIASTVEELKTNSGCHPMSIGEIEQTLLTTEETEIIEVRLEISDTWQSPDEETVLEFRFSGSCRYFLAEDRLCDLTPSRVSLLINQPDGSVRAVQGSYVAVSARSFIGAPLIQPEPVKLMMGK